MGRKGAAAALVLGLGLLGCSLAAAGVLGSQARQLQDAADRVDAFLAGRTPAPFVNSTGTAEAAAAQTEAVDALYSYTAPEGFVLLSHSEAWNEEKLGLLYEELMQNRHGEEINTLHRVVVYPEEDERALATHTQNVASVSVGLEFPALPDGFTVAFPRDVSVIALYGGDTNTTVESMARSLSHEYGHLYTFYYMFGEAGDDLGDTEYAALRDSAGSGLIDTLGTGDDVYDNHALYLTEVAAEDYVQLMGSPATRQVADFPDVRQQLAGAEYPDQAQYNSAGNWRPQENMALPLATAVPGLEAYFYGFIGQQPPAHQPEQTVELGIVSGSVGYDLVAGYRTFTHYTLGWNTPYDGAVYTLVYREPGANYYYPIKTVRPGQAPSATIGAVAVQNGNIVTSQHDGIDSGTKEFRVVCQLPDLTYYLSQPLVYSFG